MKNQDQYPAYAVKSDNSKTKYQYPAYALKSDDSNEPKPISSLCFKKRRWQKPGDPLSYMPMLLTTATMAKKPSITETRINLFLL